jgi:hypothetical protein
MAGGVRRGRPASRAGATVVTRAFGAEDGRGCRATGPAIGSTQVLSGPTEPGLQHPLRQQVTEPIAGDELTVAVRVRQNLARNLPHRPGVLPRPGSGGHRTFRSPPASGRGRESVRPYSTGSADSPRIRPVVRRSCRFSSVSFVPPGRASDPVARISSGARIERRSTEGGQRLSVRSEP